MALASRPRNEGEEVFATYENAENYEVDATLDDGTCIFNVSTLGLNYGNFDGEVGAIDLINLVTEFGLECPED